MLVLCCPCHQHYSYLIELRGEVFVIIFTNDKRSAIEPSVSVNRSFLSLLGDFCTLRTTTILPPSPPNKSNSSINFFKVQNYKKMFPPSARKNNKTIIAMAGICANSLKTCSWRPTPWPHLLAGICSRKLCQLIETNSSSLLSPHLLAGSVRA